MVDVLRTEVGRQRLVEFAKSPAGTDAKRALSARFSLDDRRQQFDLPV
jgi:hypothetical protein